MGPSRYTEIFLAIPENIKNIQNRRFGRFPGKYPKYIKDIQNRESGRVPEKYKKYIPADTGGFADFWIFVFCRKVQIFGIFGGDLGPGGSAIDREWMCALIKRILRRN